MSNNVQTQDFIDKCKAIDFSKQSVNKDINLKRIKNRFDEIQNKGEIALKKTRKPLTVVLIAAALLITATFTAFGQDIATAIKTLFIGDNMQFIFVDYSADTIPIPDGLEGLLFDAFGNELYAFPLHDNVYNAVGEEVVFLTDRSGSAILLTRLEYEELNQTMSRLFRDLDDAMLFFNGDSRFPNYIPEGFRFWTAQFSACTGKMPTDDGGDAMLISLLNPSRGYFINIVVDYVGDEGYSIYYLRQRSGSTGEQYEVNINGHEAIIDHSVQSNSLFIQIDGIMYAFASNTVSIEELIKMAESLWD